MSKCDFIIYGKHCNRFSMTNASRQKVNLTHGKKDNREKLQHDKYIISQRHGRYNMTRKKDEI